MQLRLQSLGNVNILCLPEVCENLSDSAYSHISIHRNVFGLHGGAKVDDDPMDLLRDRLARNHDEQVERDTFLIWNVSHTSRVRATTS
jgi:hypothetical protein